MEFNIIFFRGLLEINVFVFLLLDVWILDLVLEVIFSFVYLKLINEFFVFIIVDWYGVFVFIFKSFIFCLNLWFKGIFRLVVLNLIDLVLSNVWV